MGSIWVGKVGLVQVIAAEYLAGRGQWCMPWGATYRRLGKLGPGEVVRSGITRRLSLSPQLVMLQNVGGGGNLLEVLLSSDMGEKHTLHSLTLWLWP